MNGSWTYKSKVKQSEVISSFLYSNKVNLLIIFKCKSPQKISYSLSRFKKCTNFSYPFKIATSKCNIYYLDFCFHLPVSNILIHTVVEVFITKILIQNFICVLFIYNIYISDIQYRNKSCNFASQYELLLFIVGIYQHISDNNSLIDILTK